MHKLSILKKVLEGVQPNTKFEITALELIGLLGEYDSDRLVEATKNHVKKVVVEKKAEVKAIKTETNGIPAGYMTISQAAKKVGYRTNYLHTVVTKNKIPCIPNSKSGVGGGVGRLVCLKDVKEYLANRNAQR